MPLSESSSERVLQLAKDFLDRNRKGERPPLTEYINRYPDLAKEIKEVFSAIANFENIPVPNDSSETRRKTQVERCLHWARQNPMIAMLGGLLTAVLILVMVGSLFAASYLNRLRLEAVQAARNDREARSQAERAEAGYRKIAEEKEKEAEAYGLVQLVLNVDTSKVPGIIERLPLHRQWSDPLLQEVYQKATNGSPQKLHASLALLPVDPGQVDYLMGRLLDPDQREVFPVIRDALAPHKEALLDRLWTVLDKAEKDKESQRLLAAAALAKYDPNSKRWAKVRNTVVNDLVTIPLVDLNPWKDFLRPVRGKLLAPLSAVYRSDNRPGEKFLATEILADYAEDQPQVLADLIMDADERQFAIIYPRLEKQSEQTLPLLIREVSNDLLALPSSVPVLIDWRVRFYKWEDAGFFQTPAKWDAVLQSPVLDELKMSRLHFSDSNSQPTPPTSKVPEYFFALVATTDVTLDDGAYTISATSDDGVRVWLDDEVVIENWRIGLPITKKATVENKPGKHTIKVEFFQYHGPYHLGVNLFISDSDKPAKRQANAAVALLRMNQPAKAKQFWKHSPHPTVGNLLIHGVGPLGVNVRTIVKLLDEETDQRIRRVLLLSLGEFTDKELTPDIQNALIAKFQEMYRTAADAGLHSSSEWLLCSWKQEAWLKQVNEEWAQNQELRQNRLAGIGQAMAVEKKKTPQWYVNGQGQTLIVMPKPGEFSLGQGEERYQRRIERSFALASKEVTVEQFLRFRKEHPFFLEVAPESDCPVNGVNWYAAAEYCNWLSEQEGIPREQWCYEPNPDGKYAEGMKLAPNYLKRTGYRLPTEAEWEYGCRAGADTVYSFGASADMLGKYAWFAENSGNTSHPVGLLMPNDLGLFDMYGNSWEWCQDAYKPDGNKEEGKTTEDLEEPGVVRDDGFRVLRGGCFNNGVEVFQVRSGHNKYSPATGSTGEGFRVARTISP